MKKYHNQKHDIDFNDYRIQQGLEKIDIFELLDNSNLEYSLEGKNISSSKGFIGISPCPNCADSRFHAALNKDSLNIACFICKCNYGPLNTVALLKNTSIIGAAKYLISLSDNQEMDLEDRVKQILYGGNKKEKEYSYRGTDELPENRPITQGIISRNPLLKAFLKERRIKPWDIVKHDLRIGIKQHTNKIVFPVYVGGKLVSYQWRFITFKKYHIPPNLAHYLLWEDDIIESKPVLVTEGYLDALHLKSFVKHYYPDKFSVTTGFVKSLSRNQIKLLIEKNPKQVIFILDSKAWFDYKKYKDTFPMDVDFIILPDVNGKEADPNSLTFKQLKQIFKKQIDMR